MNLTKTILALVSLAFIMMAPVFAVDKSKSDDAVVGSLGNVELRLSDVRRVLEAQPTETRRQIESSQEMLDRLVRTELFSRALSHEARAKGWEKRDGVVEQLARAREQIILSTYMNHLSRPPMDYPGAEEIAALYKASEVELTLPRQYRLQQIYLDGGRAESDAVRRKADELAKQAQQKGADFGALARANSTHKSSAERGGDMGWLSEAELIPELRAAVRGMSPGQVSGPIRVDQGWHVVRLMEMKPPTLRPLIEVREVLATLLRQRKAQENERRYFDKMVEKTPISVNKIALSKLLNAR